MRLPLATVSFGRQALSHNKGVTHLVAELNFIDVPGKDVSPVCPESDLINDMGGVR